MITEGETSHPFYFKTLPTSPPSMLPCESTYNSINFAWKKPTTGMINEMVYHFDYSLSEGISGMAQGMMKNVNPHNNEIVFPLPA